MTSLAHSGVAGLFAFVLTLVAVAILVRSFWTIGPTEVGLVRKRFGGSLKDDSPIAFHGEAGYQAAC